MGGLAGPKEVGSFKELPLKVHYKGRGEIALSELIIPVLERSVRYDRATSFFDANAFLAISTGIESLWRKGGKMRLVLGVHDVPEDIVEATIRQGEWVDNVVDALRKRLLNQISTIRDELTKNKIAALAWMMADGLLEIRVAVPSIPGSGNVLQGIFHMKTLIFEDANGNIITATGSPNETVPGSSTNFENLTVHMSWREGLKEYVEAEQEGFESVWSGTIEGLDIRDLDAKFAAELLQRLGKAKARPRAVSAPGAHLMVEKMLRVARSSPSFFLQNLGKVSLYPHQESAVMAALNRWPIRVLFSDEVGLGKTLEVGATISYLIRFGGIKRAVVLAPKNLLKQWQEELWLKFGLKFWVYDSLERVYISPEGLGVTAGEGPICRGMPDLTIISYQLARGSSSSGHIFEGARELPDLLVVDEAHAARLRPDLDGTPRPTMLYRMLEELTPRVPHVLFATATPLQMHSMEYHSLLKLLGLPDAWTSLDSYDRALGLIARAERPSKVDDARLALYWIGSSVREMELTQTLCSGLDEISCQLARESLSHPDPKVFIRAWKEWDRLLPLVIRTHPAQLLTIRNTRSALTSLDYRFPRRQMHAPELVVPTEIVDFYQQVEAYLSSVYGSVEEALHPERRFNLGFVRTSYYQRLASSLHAAKLTLAKRLARLEHVERRLGCEEGPLDSGWYEDEEDSLTNNGLSITSKDPIIINNALSAISIERGYLRSLLELLERLVTEGGERDPKMEEMLWIIDDHIDSDRLLVFSRYTDTLDQCLHSFLNHCGGKKVPGHAIYTGEDSWIDSGSGRVQASKEEIKKALANGEVSVVFCSDAASEGLNLQAARVLINIDVPWNPARLEQRIGRIDRLGQSANTVEIYNLWYPNSVESRMYRRLLERRELYELAVGESPELIDESIRSDLAERFGDRSIRVADPFYHLQGIRRDIQHQAMRKMWGQGLIDEALSSIFRQGLAGLISEVAALVQAEVRSQGEVITIMSDNDEISFKTLPGTDDSLNLMHDVMDSLIAWTKSLNVSETGEAELGITMVGDIALCFSVRLEGKIFSVRPDEFPALMRSVIRGSRFQVDGRSKNEMEYGDVATHSGPSTPHPWLPRHSAMRTVYKGECPPEPFKESDEPIIKWMGKINATLTSKD